MIARTGRAPHGLRELVGCFQIGPLNVAKGSDRSHEASERAATIAVMQELITAAIGVGGTLSGTGLGYRGALAISRRDHAAALKERMRLALADYLGELYISVSELRDMPAVTAPTWFGRKLDEVRGEHAAWLARRQAEYKLTGDRYRELAGRLGRATARLQVLPLPADLRSAVDVATSYVEELAQQRTPGLKAKWSEIHAQLMAAAKALD